MNMNYREITARAWSGMLVILITMLIVDVLQFSMQGQYSELAATLAKDPGSVGLAVLLCFICGNALLQVAISIWDNRRFKSFVFWTSVLYTTFFVLHQLVHMIGGEDVGLHTVLDTSNHILGITACWASWHWKNQAT